MIVVVSGLPRSGTSLMMQMLQAGGLPLLVDAQRSADADNPRGYWEYEPVKRLPQDNTWLALAEGKAIKVITALLPYLSAAHTYRILCMQRPLVEVLASQAAMLQRRGEAPGAVDDHTLGDIFTRSLVQTERWLAQQAHMAVCPVSYHATVADPTTTARTVAAFLALPLDVESMARAVDPRLYRQREGV